MAILIVFGYVAAAIGLGLALGIITLPGLREKGAPPGPSTLPLIGNIHQIPQTGLHLWLTKCARKYGPIVSLKIANSNLVVLSSDYHVTELMDKRSSNYSNRPPSHIVGEQVFGNDHPMLMNADERWRHRRKLYFQLLQEVKCNKDHIKIVQGEAAQLLRDICLDPESLMSHPGRYSNSIIMSLVFGVRTPRYDTAHYVRLQNILLAISSIGEIGSTPPVDVIPWLKHLPERLWGSWKTRAKALRQEVDDLYGSLVKEALERRKSTGGRDSFVDRVYDQESMAQHEIEIMCGNLLEGGTDTMATTTLVLFQAMAQNPKILERAQEQIDSVVGTDRSPTWDDYEKLPYVNMIVKELLRWRPPAPNAFPHAITKDDIIDGIKIAAKSTVIVNIWGVHHDSARYDQPSIYNPSRFEGKTDQASVYANARDHANRDHFAYGTGRRICPGIHLAERGLFMAVVKILWAFDIKPKLGADGQPILIDTDPATGYKDGFLNQCQPFLVDVTVRSEAHRETIMNEFAKAEVDVFSKYM